MGKEGSIHPDIRWHPNRRPTLGEHSCGGSGAACTQTTPSPRLWNSQLVEFSDRNQTPYILTSPKEPLLLLTDLPKLLGTHFCFLFMSPFEITSSVVYYPLWLKEPFYLHSVHVCLSPNPASLLTTPPTSDRASQECTAFMGCVCLGGVVRTG